MLQKRDAFGQDLVSAFVIEASSDYAFVVICKEEQRYAARFAKTCTDCFRNPCAFVAALVDRTNLTTHSCGGSCVVLSQSLNKEVRTDA